MKLNRLKIAKELKREQIRIREELHGDVTAMIHCFDMQELINKVVEPEYTDGEIAKLLVEAGMEHAIYAL
jgi:hypothetical protein